MKMENDKWRWEGQMVKFSLTSVFPPLKPHLKDNQSLVTINQQKKKVLKKYNLGFQGG